MDAALALADEYPRCAYVAVWVIVNFSAWGLFCLLFRQTETFRAKPYYAAFNVAITIPVAAMCYYGLVGRVDWVFTPPATIQERMYGYDASAEKIAMIQIAQQVFSTVAAFGTRDKYFLKIELIGHHVITAIVMVLALQPFGHAYIGIFFGLTELSTLPLNVMDTLKQFKHVAKAFPFVALVCRLTFAIAFLVLRVGLTTYVSLGFQRDCYELYSTGAAHSVATVVFSSLANLFICALQLYWARLIVNGVVSTLTGGRKKGKNGKNGKNTTGPSYVPSMNYQQLITSSQDTARRLKTLESLLDQLLQTNDETTFPTVTHQLDRPTPSSSNTLSVTLVEMACGLLAWTSMLVGVASATRLDPLHTTLGTMACFVLFLAIVSVALSRTRTVDNISPPVATPQQAIPQAFPQASVAATDRADQGLSNGMYIVSSVDGVVSSPNLPEKGASPNINATTIDAAPIATTTPTTPTTTAPTTPTTTAPATPTTPASPFATVDQLQQDNQIDAALEAMDHLERTNVNNIASTAEFLWRKSDLLQSKCHWYTPKSTKAIEGYKQAEHLAEMAYKADPLNAKVNEVLGSIVGINMEFTNDKKEKLDATWRLIELCKTALKLDPTLFIPYHVLGRVQFGVSGIPSAIKWSASWLHSKGIPDATYKEAYDNFLLAEKNFPRKFWHTNEVMKARCLFKLGRIEEAKQCAQLISSRPWPTSYYPTHVIKKLDRAIKKLL